MVHVQNKSVAHLIVSLSLKERSTHLVKKNVLYTCSEIPTFKLHKLHLVLALLKYGVHFTTRFFLI